MYTMGALVASWISFLFLLNLSVRSFVHGIPFWRRLLLSFLRFSLRYLDALLLLIRSILFLYFLGIFWASSEQILRSYPCITVETQSETVANCFGKRCVIMWRSIIEYEKNKRKNKGFTFYGHCALSTTAFNKHFSHIFKLILIKFLILMGKARVRNYGIQNMVKMESAQNEWFIFVIEHSM